MGPILANKNEMSSTKRKNNLTNSEVTEFTNISSFAEKIVIKLHNYYCLFCAVQSDDGVIDYSEFCYLINKKDNSLSRRIFKSIDTNNDQVINFIEFIKFFGCFYSGTLDEKILLSFKIFSDSETKTIKSEIMNDILTDMVKVEKTINSYLDKDTIRMIVANTFKDIPTQNNNKNHNNEDGNLENKEEENFSICKEINFDQYADLITDNPNILNWLKLDIDHIKNSRNFNINNNTAPLRKGKSFCHY